MSKVPKFNLELSPFQVLAIMRFRNFIEEAIQDPNNEVSEMDREAIKSVMKEVNDQVLTKMTYEQLEDAEAEKALKVNNLL